MNRCPDTAYGQHSLADTKGKCLYCGQKIAPALPKRDHFGRPGYDDTELGVEYRRHYDPDYGSGKYDD